MDFSKSKFLFDKAKTLIPGGVNSPVRAFKAVGGNPVFIKMPTGLISLTKTVTLNRFN